MKLSLLRKLMILDAALLFLLGGLLILAPGWIERAFQFKDLPPAVSYIISLWGCLFATTGIGYVVAATDPLKHVIWVQVGIARGVLECIVGLICLLRGTVTFQQAGFGIIAAGLMAIAYIFCYPRPQPVSELPAS